MSYWRNKRNCAICGTEFEYRRSDKVFCDDPNCRKKASREKQAMEKTAKRALEAIRSLEAYIKTDHRLKNEALRALENLAMSTNLIVSENKGQCHIFQAGDKSVAAGMATSSAAPQQR